jgi:hypothetical protein
MSQPFGGIEEKLNRADQNIVNLNFEIERFFQECKYPTLPKDDDEALLQAIQYHKELTIPPRFSVLIGEIIHHLRSCLDHIAWHFSSADYRRDYPKRIAFPVFEDEPLDKDKLSSYARQVKGITNSSVLDLIKALQPYNAPDPLDAPIFIIHHMDIVDKHKELILCPSTVRIELPTRFAAYADQERAAIPADIEDDLYRNLKVVPQISFLNFGRRETQPVVPALKFLLSVVTEIVARFDGLS